MLVPGPYGIFIFYTAIRFEGLLQIFFQYPGIILTTSLIVALDLGLTIGLPIGEVQLKHGNFKNN